MSLTSQIKEEALRLGFTACGIGKAAAAESEIIAFDQWIASGYNADMKYMENYREIRLNPELLVEGARSVISVALNYYPKEKQSPEAPRIAYYAYGKDYHIVLKDMLRQLAAFIEKKTPEKPLLYRVFTDSAPILERYWAWKAGLGFIGKNTCLIIPGKGSFFFLGEIILNTELEYDTPQASRCGTCTSCLNACPTNAFEAPYKLNCSKCISYLTIENKKEIPHQYVRLLDNRLYGCDTCQEICPWNRFSTPTDIEAFWPSTDFLSLRKETLKTLTPQEYNRIFSKSAVKRAKYEGLKRNINHLK